MTGFTGSPRLIKGGIALVDATSAAVKRLIAFQYNSDMLSHSCRVTRAGGRPRPQRAKKYSTTGGWK